ncbi:MAG: threonylcarbamoyl-AMP synthase [Bacteroidales bacterium]|jgi:L-threonylcarbamoyladenylate synthase|nr:threonylcarbamoyl-AMP synthase [Bacteroidales bacterium]
MKLTEEIIKTNEYLKRGSVILYPTDTIWGLGCDATNAVAINRIFAIKKRRTNKSLLILLDEVEKLSLYIDSIPAIAWDLVTQANRPTTFIYRHVKNLPQNLIAPDGSIAIRIVRNEFCKRLISMLGRPIVSTSANISGMPTPVSFNQISEGIKRQVDYIVDASISIVEDVKPSTIIRFIDDYTFEIIRD